MTVKQTIEVLLNAQMDAKVILSVQDKKTADYRSEELSFCYGDGFCYRDETKNVYEIILVANAKEE